MSYGCPPITLPVFAPVPDYVPLPIARPVKLLPLKEEWVAKVKKVKAKLAAFTKQDDDYWALYKKYAKRGYLVNSAWRTAHGIGLYSMKICNMEPNRYVYCRHIDCPHYACIKK